MRVCEQIAPAAATFSRSQSITCVKGDSFWGSFRCTLSEGKIPVPEEAPWTPRTQHWRGFQPHVKKSLAPCRPERAGGKVIVFGEPGRLSPPEGDNFWGRAARLWTVRRRLSNVARCGRRPRRSRRDGTAGSDPIRPVSSLPSGRSAKSRLCELELYKAAVGDLTQSAITSRWRSSQDFPRWMVVDDRFTATNLNPVLARPGQKRPLVLTFEFTTIVRR